MKPFVLLFTGTFILWLITSRKSNDSRKILKSALIVVFSLLSTLCAYYILDSYHTNSSSLTFLITIIFIAYAGSQIIAYYYINEISNRNFERQPFTTILSILTLLSIGLTILSLSSEYGPWTTNVYRTKYSEYRMALSPLYTWTGSSIILSFWFLITYYLLTKNKKAAFFIF